MSDTVMPTIGRIVHYVAKFVDSEENAVRAAIVTAVEPNSEAEEVTLCIFHNGGIEHVHGVSHNEAEKPIQTWHWPPRS